MRKHMSFELYPLKAGSAESYPDALTIDIEQDIDDGLNYLNIIIDEKKLCYIDLDQLETVQQLKEMFDLLSARMTDIINEGVTE
jgi:hypothetical protein